MLSQKIGMDNKLRLAILGVFALVIFALPIFTLGSKRSELWVNHNASGLEDGSKDHPFKTIGAALDKAKDEAEIHVSKGEYKENITLKNGIKLYGNDKDDTIIKAKKDKWAVVTMDEKSEINGFSIKGGKRGIWVEENAKASIIDCVVKYNDKDGIAIEGGNTKKTRAVFISKTEIRNNGLSGIYSTGARRVVVVDSKIYDNEKDGIDLFRGTSAWIAGNTIKSNGGSGMKLVLDGSDVWTKNNNVRKNKREGVEVSFFGGKGRINFSKSKIVENALNGAARVQRANFSTSLWNQYLTFDNKVEFWGNGSGNISRIIFAK